MVEILYSHIKITKVIYTRVKLTYTKMKLSSLASEIKKIAPD